MTICPFCKDSFDEGETVVSCLQCGTLHHSFCWIENGNQCTVYRCDGFQEVLQTTYLNTTTGRRAPIYSAISACLIAINYIFHFFIPELKPILSAIPLPDLTVVFLIEGFFIVSTIVLLLRSMNSGRFSLDFIGFFSTLVLITNVLFVLGLAYFGFSLGWKALATAIYF